MKPNEINSMYAWTLMGFVNKGAYEECEGKSEDFKEGFTCAIECLRDQLIRMTSAD